MKTFKDLKVGDKVYSVDLEKLKIELFNIKSCRALERHVEVLIVGPSTSSWRLLNNSSRFIYLNNSCSLWIDIKDAKAHLINKIKENLDILAKEIDEKIYKYESYEKILKDLKNEKSN